MMVSTFSKEEANNPENFFRASSRTGANLKA
jgi:hypothetical protein